MDEKVLLIRPHHEFIGPVRRVLRELKFAEPDILGDDVSAEQAVAYVRRKAAAGTVYEAVFTPFHPRMVNGAQEHGLTILKRIRVEIPAYEEKRFVVSVRERDRKLFDELCHPFLAHMPVNRVLDLREKHVLDANMLMFRLNVFLRIRPRGEQRTRANA